MNHRLIKKANWILIRVKDTPKDYSCYVVHHSRSEVVFLSNNIRKGHHKDAILLALCNTLGCGDWLDMQLRGNNLPSLIELTLNKHSQVENNDDDFMNKYCLIVQGPFSDYQPQYSKRTDNPLLLLHKRTVHIPQVETEEDVWRKAAESVFGRNPLPILESYTIEVRFSVNNNGMYDHIC